GKQVYLDVRNSTLSFASNLIKSYGPFSTWNFRSNAVNAVNRWKRVYELTQQRDFNNPFDLIQSLKLETETETSLIELFRKHHVSDKLTENFCGAIIQNMYLQNQTINAFAGEVGLAGAGLVGGHLFGIRGGNGNMFGQVLAKIAAAGKAKVHYNTAVTAVADTSVVLKDGSKVEFDAVVIATPLELAGIKILVGNSQLKLQEREYKPVHVTLVAGELDLNYFHSNSSTPPASVFVKANQGLAYKSIGHTGFTTDGTKIYKFFSDQPLPEPLLDQLFSKRIDQTEHHWNGAYPVLKPKNLWPDYQLAPKVFYCNGLETAAASLETNAVSAFNVANLCKVRLTALK
ncbi:MAG: FAD-dependent oxidoreductase, partial [Bifidobacteriaceae bacterium]|nr:FAD-dependent oxidoreductase [Bifidobacteriaceae bacterium]